MFCGLRGHHLRSFLGPTDFSVTHGMALEYLIRDRQPQLSTSAAMQCINGLTTDDAYRLIPRTPRFKA